jgi:Tol biopolymer transport system component
MTKQINPNRSITAIAIALAGGVSLFGCARTSGQACTHDLDCDPCSVCIDLQCTRERGLEGTPACSAFRNGLSDASGADAPAADIPAPGAPDASSTDAASTADDAAGAEDGTTDAGVDASCSRASPVLLTVGLDGGADGPSHVNQFALSGDGRYVVYSSFATNLVPDDTNGQEDIFLFDRRRVTTTRIVVTSTGGQPIRSASCNPAISADGTSIAFYSDEADVEHVYARVYDTATATSSVVSVNSLGQPSNAIAADRTSISGDGRRVAFASQAKLVPGDGNGDRDIYVYDRQAGATELSSANPMGIAGNSISYQSTLSADGRFVAFTSAATNLVPGDSNGRIDVFVHDLMSGSTLRASTDYVGREPEGGSFDPSISRDGRYVAFVSETILTPRTSSACPGGVHIRDLLAQSTEFVAVDSAGGTLDGCSSSPSISGDGRFIAFLSNTSAAPGNAGGQSFSVLVRDRLNETTAFISDTRGAVNIALSADGTTLAFQRDGNVFVIGDLQCP